MLFNVKPHATSMAVWDVPSPIAFNDKFSVKVGVKCSAECKLVAKQIEVFNEKGEKVASGRLSETPLPKTRALYWAEVELEAPGVEEHYTWTVEFPKPDMELPHQEASHTFGFRTARPPEHVVAVQVIDEATKALIKNADVLLHPYRGCTEESGVAKLEVPKGEYELYVSAYGKETFHTTVEVASDVAIKAELLLDAPLTDLD